MASLQAHLMSFLLRHTFKRKLAKAKDAKQGASLHEAAALSKTPPDVRITAATLGGVPGEWVEPAAEHSSGCSVVSAWRRPISRVRRRTYRPHHDVLRSAGIPRVSHRTTGWPRSILSLRR